MGVLHIAGFVTVYEAFLGMEPHVDFFWWLFSPRALTMGDPAKVASVGGFALRRKPGMGDSYPAYLPCDSNQRWHGEWFYIRIVGRRVVPKRRSIRWGSSRRSSESS